jgi:type IV secretory pathway VirB2 component (pilin)
MLALNLTGTKEIVVYVVVIVVVVIGAVWYFGRGRSRY